jgi:hypothetical protein
MAASPPQRAHSHQKYQDSSINNINSSQLLAQNKNINNIGIPWTAEHNTISILPAFQKGLPHQHSQQKRAALPLNVNLRKTYAVS